MTIVHCLSQNKFCGGMFCLVHWAVFAQWYRSRLRGEAQVMMNPPWLWKLQAAESSEVRNMAPQNVSWSNTNFSKERKERYLITHLPSFILPYRADCMMTTSSALHEARNSSASQYSRASVNSKIHAVAFWFLFSLMITILSRCVYNSYCKVYR